MKYLIRKIPKDISQNDFFQIKEEKRRKINLLNGKNKIQSVLGELLLIEGLKKFYNINYQNIEFAYNKHGKPYIKTNEFAYIKYNISHTDDYVICVFSDKEIGVDIVKIKEVKKNIADKILTENEKKDIFQENIFNQKHFFIIYALKEAYFKMLGTNLVNIKAVEFSLNDNQIHCNKKNINVFLLNDINNYIIAICEKNS